MNLTRCSKLGLSLLAFAAVGLVLKLNLSSYHLEELLICWLCFSIAFVLLALAVLMLVLACYAGKYFAQCASIVAQVIAGAVQSPAKPAKTISEYRGFKR